MCTPTARRYPDLIRRAVASGAWVHTGAGAMAAEIVEHFHVDPARVRVVPPGLNGAASWGDGPPSIPAGGRPYLLGLGTTEPRKGFPDLIEAFGLVAPLHADLELRIAGPAGWAEAEVMAAIEQSAYRSRIRRLGWVHDGRSLMAGAAVFAYPSVYEGFGLPPLEAMSLGVPVVATAVGAVPEVVGTAAELVAPGDPAALAGAIDHVLSDPVARARLVEAGRARVTEFSWKKSGDAFEALYRDVASS
jgi:glycosyltransferase involved in cell wall biosynthesis